MDAQDVTARMELRQLVDAYAATVDARDLAGFQALFVEDLLMVIRYRDDYARTAGGWRFARREVRIQWTEVHPASLAPLGDF